jgi:hypothetical protein
MLVTENGKPVQRTGHEILAKSLLAAATKGNVAAARELRQGGRKNGGRDKALSEFSNAELEWLAGVKADFPNGLPPISADGRIVLTMTLGKRGDPMDVGHDDDDDDDEDDEP